MHLSILLDSDKYLEICKLLLLPTKAGQSLSEEQRTLLNAGDNDKNTPLHLAAKYGSMDVFFYLLEQGRQLNDQKSPTENYGITEPLNRTDRSPLLECAKHNRLSFIRKWLPSSNVSTKLLLENTKDQDQMKCIHLACRYGKHRSCI